MKTTRLLSFLFVLIFSFGKIQGQTYHVLLDKNVSSISAAETLTSLHYSIYTFEDKLIPKKMGEKIISTWLQKNTGRFFRLFKGIVWDFPLANLFSNSQGLIFGFGAQYRSFDYVNNSFNISAPPPYGAGGGFAQRGKFTFPRNVGNHESMMMHSGGTEANRILSNTIIKKWLLSDSIHYKEAILSVRNFNSPHYGLLGLRKATADSDYSLTRYLSSINNYYGFEGFENHRLTNKHISKKAWINFLNPFIAMSFYSGVVNYGFGGKRYGKLYWIKIRNLKYLPSFRLNLTPFGDEIYSEHFFKKENKAARIYYRHGNPVFEKHNGFGMETINAINLSNKILLDFHLDIWSQPPMELGGEELRISKSGLGHLMKMSFQIRLWTKPNPLYLSGQFGYKTDGYIEGEPLSNGLIFRYGMAFNL